MKHIKTSVVAMAGLVLAAASGHANTLIGGSPADELSVDAVLKQVYGPGNYSRVDDSSDIDWTITGNSSATFEAIYSGATQSLSVTDTHGNNSVTIFDNIPASPVNNNQLPTASLGSATPFFTSSNPFLFLDQPNGGLTIASSDPALSTGGVDRMITYLVKETSGATGYVIAFEDGSDFDFNDLMVQVDGVSPVPEPTTIIAGALLLLPLGASALRGFRKSRLA
jgi:hypothetical protein